MGWCGSIRNWMFLLWSLHTVRTSLSELCPASSDLLASRFTMKFLTSPNYPGDYPNNAECLWRIIACCPGDHVKIVVESFELEENTFDYLEFFDGLSTSDKRLGRWGADNIPPTSISSNSSITVVFHSDGDTTREGFALWYISESPEISSTSSISAVFHSDKDATRQWHIPQRRETFTHNSPPSADRATLIINIIGGVCLGLTTCCICCRVCCKLLDSLKSGTRRSTSDQSRSALVTPEVYIVNAEEHGGGFDGPPPPYSSSSATRISGTGQELAGTPVRFSPLPPYETIV